jgi:hypothetical protein
MAERERQVALRETAVNEREVAANRREQQQQRRQELVVGSLRAAPALGQGVVVPVPVEGPQEGGADPAVGVLLPSADAGALQQARLVREGMVSRMRILFVNVSVRIGEGDDSPSTRWSRASCVKVVHEILRGLLEDQLLPRIPLPLPPAHIATVRHMFDVILTHLADPAGGGTEDAEGPGALLLVASLLDSADAGLSIAQIEEIIDAAITLGTTTLALGQHGPPDLGRRIAMGQQQRAARDRLLRLVFDGSVDRRSVTQVRAVIEKLAELFIASFRAVWTGAIEAVSAAETERSLTEWFASGPLHAMRWQVRAARAVESGAGEGEGGGRGPSTSVADLASSTISREEYRELCEKLFEQPFVRQGMGALLQHVEAACRAFNADASNSVRGTITELRESMERNSWMPTWWSTCVRLAGLDSVGVDAPTLFNAAIGPIRQKIEGLYTTQSEQAWVLRQLSQWFTISPSTSGFFNQTRRPGQRTSVSTDASWRERMRGFVSTAFSNVRAVTSANVREAMRIVFDLTDLDKDGRVSASELQRLQALFTSLLGLAKVVLPPSGESPPSGEGVEAGAEAGAAAGGPAGRGGERAVALQEALLQCALAFFDVIDRNEDGEVDASEMAGFVIAVALAMLKVARLGMSQAMRFPRLFLDGMLDHGGGVLWPQGTPGEMSTEELDAALRAMPEFLAQMIRSIEDGMGGADTPLTCTMGRLWDRFIASSVGPDACADPRCVEAVAEILEQAADADPANNLEDHADAISAFTLVLRGIARDSQGRGPSRDRFKEVPLDALTGVQEALVIQNLSEIFDDEDAACGFQAALEHALGREGDVAE